MQQFPTRGQRGHSGQRGMSVVELMVGLTVGLIVIAAAATVFAAQLQHTRHAVLEARLQQDLRAVAALVVRDLRRAGHWSAALRQTQWPAQANPYREVNVSPNQQSIVYHYARDAEGGADVDVVDANEQFGFRVVQQVLHTRAGTGQWQSLTDRQVLRITRLQFALDARVTPAEWACLAVCSNGALDCPQSAVRLVNYEIEAQAAPPHSEIRQRVRGSVRLRNDDTRSAGCPA